jgi:hypothetical protein
MPTHKLRGLHRLPSLSALGAAMAIATAGAASAQTVANPGFDAFQNDTAALIPTNRYLDAGDGLGPDEQLYVAMTGAAAPGELADVPAGFALLFGGGGILRHDVEFQTPTGPMGFISSDAGAGAFGQTLAGTTLQPNTTYVLTVDVSDRDTSSFTNGTDIVAVAPDINAALFAGSTASEVPSVKSFTPPTNGGTSTFTVTATTGPDVSGLPGDLILAFSASGSSVAGPIVATQTYFDNVTFTIVPEPAALPLLLGSAAVVVGGRRRRNSTSGLG